MAGKLELQVRLFKHRRNDININLEEIRCVYEEWI